MTRPWEETWEYYSPNGFAGFFAKHVGKKHRGSLFEGTDDTDDERARAKLAAAAPDMARVLLEIEWAGRSQYGEPRCPACNGEPPRDDKPWRPSHAPGCALVAALHKAGVRVESPQSSDEPSK